MDTVLPENNDIKTPPDESSKTEPIEKKFMYACGVLLGLFLISFLISLGSESSPFRTVDQLNHSLVIPPEEPKGAVAGAQTQVVGPPEPPEGTAATVKSSKKLVPTPTAESTPTPAPTATPNPTSVPEATQTPAPTASPTTVPTLTDTPTQTPTPGE